MNQHPQKDNASAVSNEKAVNGSMYFSELANTYHRAKKILLILLAVFLVIVLLFAGGSLNSLRFRYLFKYVLHDPASPKRERAEITYAAGTGAKFFLFHDDLAVLGEGKAALYSLSGDVVYRSDIEKGIVSLSAAKEMFAVYVPGKSHISFFHSFGKATEIDFSSPVSRVNASAGGITAVCVGTTGETQFHMLNERFETTSTFSFEEGIVMHTAISPDGKTLAVLSLIGENGIYRTMLSLLETKNGSLLHTETYASAKPSAISFFEDGRFFVMLDNALLFYDANGDEKESFSLIPGTYSYHTDGNNLFLRSASGEIALYKSRGKCLFAEVFGAGILEAKTAEGNSYLLTERALFILNDEGECFSELSIEGGVIDFFLLRDGSILLCYPTETKQVP